MPHCLAISHAVYALSPVMIFTWYLFWMSSDTVERVVDFSGQSNRRKPQCVSPDSMVARGMDLSYA